MRQELIDAAESSGLATMPIETLKATAFCFLALLENSEGRDMVV